MCRIIISFIFFLNLFSLYYSNNNIAYNIPDPECTGVFNLCTDIDKERLGRQAVRLIHEQMDDDKDGMIEASESTEFIKEELESKTDSIRHRHFQNADLQITFNDLWKQWQNSAVYNWTTDNVVDWLVNYVHLPIYIDNFRRNQFDGRMIPRLAANDKHYLSSIMQIRDPRHKRRLVIKATDVVLFGPPSRTHNLIKDMILMSALIISFGACLYAYIRHRKTQESMKTMLKELETLQKAEGDLIAVTGKMKAMENELKEKPKADRVLLNSWFVEVQKTKEEADRFRKRRDSTNDPDKQLRLALQEIEQLRIALRKAEEHAQHQSYEPPNELIDLLKRTHHNEEIAFEIKRKLAENSMLIAKEQMNKISKMQKGFLGAVRIAHTGCMDNISELINSAKERLAEVQDEYEEREKRWNRIASLLDRDDLISTSSTSSISLASNQYLTNSAINNGNTNSTSIDTYSRPKQVSVDSNNLFNTNSDSLSIHKSNSNLFNRATPTNPIISVQTSEHDNNFDSFDSTSAQVKRRTMANNRLLPTSKVVYSYSANGLNNINRNSSELVKQNTDDSLDMILSTKSNRPIFDIVTDQQFNTNDSQSDDLDKKSQLSISTYDDQRSISSPEKKRKQLSNRLLKPFQNMRFRKKSNT